MVDDVMHPRIITQAVEFAELVANRGGAKHRELYQVAGLE
jgi:hypothetical protein